MTGRTNVDRELSSYLKGRSTSRAPAGLLDAILGEVDQTRQRPAWRLIGRSLAERRTVIWMSPASARLALLFITLTIALAISLIVIAGSQRRLPPPFGPARPGLLVVDVSGHIGLMKADGTGLTQLTSAPEVDSYPTWSPDGTRFAFVASKDLALAVVVMDADGRHRITVADQLRELDGSVGTRVGLSWSPDSQRIVFAAAVGDTTQPQLYTSDANRFGATRILAPDQFGTAPSWSPDGTWIAFKSVYPCCGNPPSALWLTHPDGSAAHLISNETGDLTGTVWAPDSKRLAFLANGTDHSNDIYVINADRTGQRDVTNTPQDEFWPSWSPDGTKLAFSWFVAANGTFVIDADGSNRVEVPTNGYNVSTPVWSPDGSTILGYADGPAFSGGATDGLMILDPTGHDRPMFIAEPDFGSVTWQRLAP